MPTPEGRIKNKIKLLLDSYGDRVYTYMPVPAGYGKRTLDYLGCINGEFFAIEAKRPGGKPTSLQSGTIEDICNAGGAAFVVHNDDTLADLKSWLDAMASGEINITIRKRKE
jgi:hypothetical protein